jgi:hypothetical protein
MNYKLQITNEWHTSRLGQVRWSFVNVLKAFERLGRICSDYRLDRMKGAAIADPETGSSPGNLLTHCNAFLTEFYEIVIFVNSVPRYIDTSSMAIGWGAFKSTNQW